MAGDDTKRSEAGTEPEVGAAASEPPAPTAEPSVEPSQGHETTETPTELDAAPAIGTEDAAPDEPPDAEDERPAPPASADTEDVIAPAPIELSTAPVEPAASASTSDADSRAAPRARTPVLRRLVPYLVVFAVGAIFSIGAAFILNLLAGAPPESRGDLDQRLVTLDERATALETKQEQDSATFGALAERFATAETQVRQAISAVREVEQSLAAHPASGASSGEGSSGQSVDLGPLAARLAAIEQRLDQNKVALGGSGTAVEASGAAGEIARAQAAAIVAGRLVQEVERGEAYFRELNALLALGVDDAELAPLRTFAETGVASPHRLSDEFARRASAVLAAERKADNDSLVERLKGYASNLVQIERMDDLARKDAHGLVARIKLALAHDDVAEAYALWIELPEAAKTSSESFGTAAKNRLDALAAARSIEAGAVTALSKPKS